MVVLLVVVVLVVIQFVVVSVMMVVEPKIDCMFKQQEKQKSEMLLTIGDEDGGGS